MRCSGVNDLHRMPPATRSAGAPWVTPRMGGRVKGGPGCGSPACGGSCREARARALASCHLGRGAVPGCPKANGIWWCPFLNALLAMRRPSELEFGGARPPPEPRGFCRASLSPGGPPEPHGEPPALVGEAAAFHTRAHSGFPDPAQERELNLWAGSTGWLDGWAFQKRRAAGRRSG